MRSSVGEIMDRWSNAQMRVHCSLATIESYLSMHRLKFWHRVLHESGLSALAAVAFGTLDKLVISPLALNISAQPTIYKQTKSDLIRLSSLRDKRSAHHPSDALR